MNGTMTKERLREYLRQSGKSQSAASKAIGVSQTTLNQYMNDKYPGDVDGLEDQIELWLRRETARAAKADLGEFQMTSVAKDVTTVLQFCHVEGDMGVIYGYPGIGKTEAVKHYHKLNQDTILFTADPSYSSSAVVKELASLAEVQPKGRKFDIIKKIIERLEGKDTMVMIDEAQFLRLDSFEILRRIHDATHCGIVFVGQPILDRQMRGREEEFFAQIVSRIGIRVELEMPNPADVDLLCDAAMVQDKGARAYLKKVLEKRGASLRTVHKLMKLGLRVAMQKGESLNEDILRESSQFMAI